MINAQFKFKSTNCSFTVWSPVYNLTPIQPGLEEFILNSITARFPSPVAVN